MRTTATPGACINLLNGMFAARHPARRWFWLWLVLSIALPLAGSLICRYQLDSRNRLLTSQRQALQQRVHAQQQRLPVLARDLNSLDINGLALWLQDRTRLAQILETLEQHTPAGMAISELAEENGHYRLKGQVQSAETLARLEQGLLSSPLRLSAGENMLISPRAADNGLLAFSLRLGFPS